MEATAVRSGGFGGGVEWAGGRWRLDQRSVVAASALECLVEHCLRSVVKIGARRCMAGDRKGGSTMREGWAEIFKCVMSVSACEDCVRSVKHLKVK